MKIILFLITLSVSVAAMSQVSPLLSTTWNQTCYYNALMPAVGSGGSCGNAYTGCNATAMAQICKYYAYPTTGFGSHCNSNSPTDCADFSLANYDYSSMPNNVTSSNPEVAALMYDLGVSVDMNWNGTNSTSFFSSKVLKKHFAYSPKMYSTAVFLFGSTAELIAAIKIELDEGRPVYAKGGGHFYLIDGYNASDEFHMNFGWSGTYDGYYPIDGVVNPGGTFNPSNFIFNIMPMADDLETAKDTIFIGSGGSISEELEFTSLSNWSMSSSESWITPALTSGSAGYFDSNEGSTATIELNNDSLRTGYVIISNASETDTIVVVQESSPLEVAPNPINFTDAGGVENISITYTSWGNWNATVNETWLSLSASSGTGPSTIDVTCTANSGLARTAELIIDGGTYVDTVLVTQDSSSVLTISDLSLDRLSVYPNPTNGKIRIQNVVPNSDVTVQTVAGEIVLSIETTSTTVEINIDRYPAGVYFIKNGDRTMKVINVSSR